MADTYTCIPDVIEEGFQQPTQSQCQEKIDNENTFSCFLKQVQQDNG